MSSCLSEVAQGFRPRIPTTAGTGREGRPRPRSARCPHPRSMRSCPAERQSAQLDLAAVLGGGVDRLEDLHDLQAMPTGATDSARPSPASTKLAISLVKALPSSKLPEEICGVMFTTESCISVAMRSEEHTSELQSRGHLVCRLLLEKKK